VIDVPDKGGEPARQPDDLAGLLPLDSYGGDVDLGAELDPIAQPAPAVDNAQRIEASQSVRPEARCVR
jgi:hypothetical protein